MSHTACTIVHVEPQHNPNEGRTIINQNFDCLYNAIDQLELISATGSTSVSSGNNISVSMVILSGVPDYTVSVIDDPIFNSVSANTISATTLYSGSTNIGDLLTGISASVLYTNTGATPTTIGGISAGSTFSGKTMQEMWDALLYPYQAPAFTSFSRTNLSTTYEVGETVLLGSQTFTWATSNSPNVSANTITIVQNVPSTTTIYGPGANVGTSAITVSGTYSAGTSTSTTLYTITGYNSLGSPFSTTISRNWRFRIYYGTNSLTTLTESDIESLLNNPLSSGFAGTYSFVSGDYKYFCYPDSFGSPTAVTGFKDTSTNLPIAMADLTSDPFYSNLQNGWYYGLVSVTNTFGVTVNYRVYRSYNILGSSINIQVS